MMPYATLPALRDALRGMRRYIRYSLPPPFYARTDADRSGLGGFHFLMADETDALLIRIRIKQLAVAPDALGIQILVSECGGYDDTDWVYETHGAISGCPFSAIFSMLYVMARPISERFGKYAAQLFDGARVVMLDAFYRGALCSVSINEGEADDLDNGLTLADVMSDVIKALTRRHA